MKHITTLLFVVLIHTGLNAQDCSDLCSLDWFDTGLLAIEDNVGLVQYDGSTHIFVWYNAPTLPSAFSSLFDCAGNEICSFDIGTFTDADCPGFDISLAVPIADAPVVNECFDECRVDPTLNCPAVYEPVCGCDGTTYSNSCVADISGILSWTNGECDDCQYPILNPDSYTLYENQDSCLYVRYNDNLLQDIGLIYSLVNQPTNGTVVEYNIMEGCFEFVAEPGFSGSIAFQYQVCYLDFPCNGSPETCATETVVLEILADTSNAIGRIPYETMTVFPNPTNHNIRFNSNATTLDRFEIVNLLGETVMAGKLNSSGDIGLDISGLPNALYFVHAYASTRRFVGRFEKAD